MQYFGNLSDLEHHELDLPEFTSTSSSLFGGITLILLHIGNLSDLEPHELDLP